MFPRADRPVHPVRAWADTLRRGLDVLVAFATLRDADTPSDDEQAALELAPARSADRVERSAARPVRHSAGSGAAHPKTGRGPAGAEHPIHPHRRTLTAPVRQRRPGAVRAQSQPCLTPLRARRARRPGVSTGGAR
jgi:hypothetical protein